MKFWLQLNEKRHHFLMKKMHTKLRSIKLKRRGKKGGEDESNDTASIELEINVNILETDASYLTETNEEFLSCLSIAYEYEGKQD